MGDRVKKVLAVRIVQTQMKVVYVLSAALISYGVNAGLLWIGLPRLVGIPLGVLMSLAIYLYGARVFRGNGEPIAPARAWWRMTAERRLSALFGVLFLMFVLVSLTQLFVAITNANALSVIGSNAIAAAQVEVVYWAGLLIWALVLMVMYFNSAVRIQKPVELPVTSLR